MRTSEKIITLAPALLKAQREIKDVVKDGTNPHFKSKYATLESVIGVCKEALNANGIVFIQGGEETNGELLVLYTRLVHESGEWIESAISMKPVKADPQGIGSCITYARRYSLAAICGVASEEDDDGNAASHAPKTDKPEPKAKTNPGKTPEMVQQEVAVQVVRDLFKKLPEPKRTLGVMKTILPISDFAQVQACSIEQLNAGIDRLNEMLTEAK